MESGFEKHRRTAIHFVAARELPPSIQFLGWRAAAAILIAGSPYIDKPKARLTVGEAKAIEALGRDDLLAKWR